MSEELRNKLLDTLTACAGILDTVKVEWAAENVWSEHDQEVRDSVSKCLAALHNDPALMAVWPLNNPDRLKTGIVAHIKGSKP
jgi:chaperonin GroEL (HSP60 family)